MKSPAQRWATTAAQLAAEYYTPTASSRRATWWRIDAQGRLRITGVSRICSSQQWQVRRPVPIETASAPPQRRVRAGWRESPAPFALLVLSRRPGRRSRPSSRASLPEDLEAAGSRTASWTAHSAGFAESRRGLTVANGFRRHVEDPASVLEAALRSRGQAFAARRKVIWQSDGRASAAWGAPLRRAPPSPAPRDEIPGSVAMLCVPARMRGSSHRIGTLRARERREDGRRTWSTLPPANPRTSIFIFKSRPGAAFRRKAPSPLTPTLQPTRAVDAPGFARFFFASGRS